MGPRSPEQELSQAVEDYLKAVYSLGKPGQPVSTAALAERLEVAPASVTGMLKRLSELGYVDYTPRQGVELSRKGLEVALEIIRHHRLLELFFVKRLGMDWAQAHREAEVLEHFISEELEMLIDKMLDHPEEDPQGAPIPTREGRVRSRRWMRLAEAEEGARLVVRRVEHDDPELLRYVEQLGLVPGTAVRVMSVAPFEGPITIEHDGQTLSLGVKVAGAIGVEAAETSKRAEKGG